MLIQNPTLRPELRKEGAGAAVPDPEKLAFHAGEVEQANREAVVIAHPAAERRVEVTLAVTYTLTERGARLVKPEALQRRAEHELRHSIAEHIGLQAAAGNQPLVQDVVVELVTATSVAS